ncbi:hypothetical protein FACS1894124_1120 [Spirochaetia bacterium]|nr:hypothetical protein FACS1894124_1120 [Spirochaetia bacterium]
MSEERLNRQYLESLTTNELTVLADSRGIDIPPGLERIFIIAELLEAASDDDFPPDDDEALPPAASDFRESVALPKRYNITYIDVLIRDPLWVFAFWEIKNCDKETHENASDFGGYCLKVSPADGAGMSPADEYPFTVPVGITDTAWYLGFSRGGGADGEDTAGRGAGSAGICQTPRGNGHLRVELCVLRGEETLSLAVSKPFALPSLFPPPGRNPLALLSGLDDLPVLRNADRLSRTLKPA